METKINKTLIRSWIILILGIIMTHLIVILWRSNMLGDIFFGILITIWIVLLIWNIKLIDKGYKLLILSNRLEDLKEFNRCLEDMNSNLKRKIKK